MSASAAPQPVKLSLPLEFQQDLFKEIRSEDELVILARGLGLMRVITNLLHSYDAAGNNLILIVGAEDRENAWIGEALAEHAAISSAPLARGLTMVNTDLTSVGAREKMYAKGGIFSITSRILVVDVLTSLLRAETVTGVVVLHAERVVATSLEAFILRVYRQKNKTGFLKAFSDNPDAFTTGFAPLATMMRNLFLKKASLWPRFHVSVAASLEGKKKAEVIELEVPMTGMMKTIQAAVLECVEASIQELRKGNSELDMEDWTMDNALLKNFDVVVRRQLEPNWHRVSWKTKQIVGDLTVLRGLLHSLLAYDPVSFLQHLDTIHAAHAPAPGSTRQNESPWMFLDAAQTLFETARRRVYAAGRVTGATAGQDIDSLKPVLEELPKWQLLAEILDEIDRELYFQPPAKDDSNGTILVMCSDTDTCRQLRDYLQTMHVKPTINVDNEVDAEERHKPSAVFMMRRRLRNYLTWKGQFARVNAALFAENKKALNSAADTRPGQTPLRGKAPANKRRRVRGGGNFGTSLGRAENGSIQQYFEKPGEVIELMDGVQAAEEYAEWEQRADVIVDDLEDMEDYFQLYAMQDLVVVHAYDGDMEDHVLEEVKPRYIIMYEPDAAFIRRVEVYRSSHNDRNVKVYFMYYGDSVEEQRYLSSVRREKDSFTKLIRERASMAVMLDTPGGETSEDAFLRTINTRIAGGGRLAATAEPPRVVVDVREFRSSLPSLLHGRNIVIVPCMLTVGDYVLSPNIVVERKSISDLVSSFKDGRLYAQCESMFAHYKSPMLLIEFDQNKSFTLETFADLSGNLSSMAPTNLSSDLQSKIVLLTLAFPRLRIIWSSSPFQTAEIFENLKGHMEEPDPISAVRAGLDPDVRIEDRTFNAEPSDMMSNCPGVTPKNLMNIVLEAENIREVANMDVNELEGMVGPANGRIIWRFFNRNVAGEDEESSSDVDFLVRSN